MSELSTDDACVSDLVLDEWLASELDESAGERVRAHLAHCPICQARKTERERDREQFLHAAPNFAAYREQVQAATRAVTRDRRSRRAWFRGTAVGALAVAASVWLAAGLPQPSATRSKGGAHLGFFVKHGERVTRGKSGQTVEPGDELRFTYTSPRPAYLAMVNVDANAATVYFPNAGQSAVRVAAGNDVALDFSVELDALPGTERVYAVFCAKAYALEPVRAALQATGRAPQSDDFEGCELDAITLRKDTLR